MNTTRAPRSWLYVPATRPDRVEKALASRAEAIIVDLEDSVPAGAKVEARKAVLDLAARVTRPFHVRVNDLTGPWGLDDLRALARVPVAGVRLPKTESADQVGQAVDALQRTEEPVPIHVLLESALGVENAFAIAMAHPTVAGISLGEADLRASLRISDDGALDWARSRVVNASRAAGLPSPAQSVYTDVADEEGLRASSERGRAMGFFGRALIHPRQIPAVHAAYTPSARERREAADLLAGLEAAHTHGSSAFLTTDGRFVDPAVVQAARAVLATDPIPENEEETP